MKESLLYEKLDGRRVRCHVCAVRCVIPDGARGVCATRINRSGTLYTLIYGRVASVCVDPIEKKPVFHYLPGARILSLGTLGCNFHCPGCQNWQISHAKPGEPGDETAEFPPHAAVEVALREGCRAIGWTYNDPTIWLEYTLDTARLARARGLATAYITNGYATPEHLELVGPYLDIWRVDIKSFSRASHKRITRLARFDPLLDATKLAKFRYGMHVECVTNVTPTINDTDEILRGIARWIHDELGPDTPWHVTRFHPHLDLSHIPPTPIADLERARQIGLDAGLRFVYIGNVPGHPGEDTFCPGCGDTVIRRCGFAVARQKLRDGRCPGCGERIPGRFDGADRPRRDSC